MWPAPFLNAGLPQHRQHAIDEERPLVLEAIRAGEPISGTSAACSAVAKTIEFARIN